MYDDNKAVFWVQAIVEIFERFYELFSSLFGFVIIIIGIGRLAVFFHLSDLVSVDCQEVHASEWNRYHKEAKNRDHHQVYHITALLVTSVRMIVHHYAETNVQVTLDNKQEWVTPE